LPIWGEEEKNKSVNHLSFKERRKEATSRKELEIIDLFALSDTAASSPKHAKKKHSLKNKKNSLSTRKAVPDCWLRTLSTKLPCTENLSG
jgi:hypothetical protein